MDDLSIIAALEVLKRYGEPNDWRKLFNRQDLIEKRFWIFLYQSYLLSHAWKVTRNIRLKIDEFKCQVCGAGAPLDVHHLNYERLGAENQDDLKTLCAMHHQEEHFDPCTKQIAILLRTQQKGWQNEIFTLLKHNL